MADVDVVYCEVCKEKVLNSDKALKCESNCHKWFHIKCVGILVKEYDMINKLSTKILWFCADCKTNPTLTVASVGNSCNKSVLNIDVLVEKLLNIVKGLVTDNELIVKKLNDLATDNIVIKDRLSLDAKCQTMLSPNILSVDKLDVNDLNIGEPNPNGIGNSIRNSKPMAGVSGTIDGSGTNTGILNNNDNFIITTKKKRFSKACQDNNGRPTLTHLQKSYASVTATKPNLVTPRPRPVVGRKSASGQTRLVSVKKLHWIFISRLDPGVCKADVMMFLNSNGITGHSCEDVESRFTTYKSFKIGVNDDFKVKLLDPDFWDEGILVKEYIPKRRNLGNNHFLAKVEG